MALGTMGMLALGASAVGTAAQVGAANRATRAQENAANQQIGLQRETRDMIREDFAPFRETGGNALAALQSELGLGPRPEGFAGLSMSPAGLFALEQGRDIIEAGAAARGGLFSGSSMNALERTRGQIAANDRENQLNRLTGLAGMGQASAGMQAQANTNFANMAGQALGSIGDARAAGSIATGNAINSGMNNALGSFAFMRGLDRGLTPPGWS